MANARKRLVAALGAALAVCAACSPGLTPTPTLAKPTETETSRFSTHTGPVVRATLPATWTETPTPSATLTPSATPVTPTATATPVPALADLCASLSVNTQLINGFTFRWNNAIVMTLGTPLSAVLNPATGKAIPLTVRFLANNLLNGQNQGVELNGGLVAVMELPINQLPGPGLYTWKVAIYGDGMDEQCLHQGFFFVTRSADDLMTATARALITPTPMPTVEFTDEATQDGTIIPIFQGNIPIPGGSG